MKPFASLVFLLQLFALQIVFVKLNVIFSPSNTPKIAWKEAEDVKTLRVALIQSEPFVYRDERSQSFKGIEFELVKTIAKKEHLNIFFKIQCNQMALKEFDIAVGGLFPNFTSLDFYSISNSYYQDDLTWCTQKAKNMLLLFRIFSIAEPACWIALYSAPFGAGLFLYVFIQFDVEDKHRNHRDFSYIMIMIVLPGIIGLNQRYNPKHQMLRLLWFYFSILFVMGWVIFFFQLLRFIKMPVLHWQISTVDELNHNRFHLSGSNEVLSLITTDEMYGTTQVDSFSVCKTIDDCLEELKHDDNYNLAVGGSRQNILNSRSYSPSKIFCFDRDESIVSYHPALMMRNGFHLKSRINRIIQNAFESGLFEKWNRDYQRKKERLIPFEPPDALNINHFTPVIVNILVCGSFLSILAFICELFIHRKLNEQKRSRIWMYLEQFIDGDRHYLKNLPEKLMSHRK